MDGNKHLKVWLSTLGLILAFAFANTSAFAAPILGWDSANHVWVQVSPDNTYVQIGASPGNAGGNIIPDVLNVACPPSSTTVLSTTSIACFVAPNDGHTYQLVSAETRQTSACGAGASSYAVEVAPNMTPVGSGSAQVIVACSTAVVANQGIAGSTATPSTGAGTPTPTPVLLAAGGQVNMVYTSATAVTGLTGSVTLKRAT